MRKLSLFLPLIISRVTVFFTLLAQTLRLMVGVGDYAVYLKHMQDHHPDAQALNREQWFRARLDARYGVGKDGAVKRCPC